MCFLRLLRPCAPSVALAAALLSLGACQRAARVPARIQVVAAQANQQVVVDVDAARAAIKVESPSGTGSAELNLTAGAWPPEVVLQLSLKGLEELRFTCGDTTVVVSVASGGTHEVRESLSTGATAPAASPAARPLSPDSRYWMNVAIPAGTEGGQVPDTTDGGTPAGTTGGQAPGTTDGGAPAAAATFDVTVPAAFLRGGHQSFRIAWIDFYR